MRRKIPSTRRKLAYICILTISLQIFMPLPVFALTSGPAAPEFSSFEPVATTDMVNPFSGDFTYNLPVINVPGANGGGYALSLSYHSGITVEQEASWVGLGWSLNPGSISRNTRGFPDDWKDEKVTYWNKVPKNWTVAVGGKVKAELFSFDLPVGLNASLRYNNYQGFGYTAGLGIELGKGVVSLGYHVDNGSGSFSVALNPAAALQSLKDKGKSDNENPTEEEVKKGREKAIAEQDSYRGKKGTALRQSTYNAQKKQARDRNLKNAGVSLGSFSLVGSQYGMFSHAGVLRSTQTTKYKGTSFTLTPSVLGTLLPIQAGPTYNLFGSYSEQENIPNDDLLVHGYMYSNVAGSESVMDYYLEKSAAYQKRDRFLSIPFSNVDNYTISGEGIGGGFRMYQKQAGHYGPNEKKSVTDIYNLGVEIEAGLNLGGGGDYGFGLHTIKQGKWQNLSSFANPDDNAQDEAVFFRFNNDLGGEVDFFANDNAQRASINYAGGIPGAKDFSASLPSGLKTFLNDGDRSMRSSYIGFSRNKDFGVIEDSRAYRTYSKQNIIETTQFDRSVSNIDDQIGEFSVVNEDGNRYVYGLPVFSRNERNLQFALEGLGSGDIDHNYIAYKNIHPISAQKTVVGEVRPTPYATTYLLTEITDADYIDRTQDGPTEDDFGGWTRFGYDQKYGALNKKASSSTNWYQWRVPYKGLLYNRNELSNPGDDMGTLGDGEKEVYYLRVIETKTHIAEFYSSDREDGYSAEADPGIASDSQTAMGNKPLCKLDSIKLFAKADLSIPLKTVRFEYDYSLCGKVSNNSEAVVMQNGANINQEKGKLTLKRIWFEYDGIVSAKISPYEFSYNYPTVDYPARYNALESYGSAFNQNPDYSPFHIDAWGNNQEDDGTRFENLQNWVNQVPPASFDPAAWHLKAITLPSRGQIHVQYEQDEYQYVQDQRAHSMVSFENANSSDLLNKYYLDYSKLGLTAADLPELKALIEDLYVIPEKRMYFKFLYKLIGAFSDPQIEDCNAEYLKGYVNVKEVGIDNGGNKIYVKLGLPGISGLANAHDLPRKVCMDYVKTQKAGNLSIDGSICDASVAGVDNTGGAEDVIMGFVGFATTFSFPASTCNVVNMERSYLRIPMLKAKKGGGVRVKRLLLYDEGIDANYPQLFGSEYLYETTDPTTGEIISSGVATNEPQTIREENVLVGFLERFKQSFINKIISGIDSKQSEGPLGESIMPAPSVGYAKVITRNIHSGKTNPGFSVSEYHTAKDYPFICDITDLDNSKKDYLPLPLGLINRYVNNQWLSQGFSFVINGMHGQMKRQATYGGDYNNVHSPSSSQLSSLRAHTYFEPGEPVEYWNGFEELPTPGYPGKEEELIYESNKISDINNDGNVEFDVDVGFFGVLALPFASAFPSLTFAETELYTHKTVKIIRHPTILKSTTTYQDGIYHLTTNRYFDEVTGQPIVTKTTDGYNELDLLSATDHDGVYTNYRMPAHRTYPNTGQKAKNERKWVFSTTDVWMDKVVPNASEAYLHFAANPPNTVCDAMNNFSAGDLVEVSGHIYHLGKPSGSDIPLLPIEGGVIGGGDLSVDVEIAKSGRTNQLNMEVGGITTYGVSTTTTTPIPAAVMSLRNQVANLLDGAISSGAPIYSNQIPVGLQFIDKDGNCGSFPVDHYITIHSGSLWIMGPAPPPIGGVIGTPTNPHPMVTALNNYFDTYFDYSLLHGSTATTLCGYNANEIQTVSNASPDVNYMQSQQTAVLNTTYSGVNSAVHATSDFFEDLDINIGEAITRKIGVLSGDRRNRSVILRELSTGNQFGIRENCVDNELMQLCTYFCSPEDSIYCPTYPFRQPEPQHREYPVFGQTIDGYLYATLNEKYDTCHFDIRFYEVREFEDVVICQEPLNISGGNGDFVISPDNGALVYYSSDNPCFPQELKCLQFCEEVYPSTTISQVVASNAATLSDNWPYEENHYYPLLNGNYNVYETGRRGKWRAASSYVYKEDITGIQAPFGDGAVYAATDEEKAYNAGVYELELFNWVYPGANNSQKWLGLNTTTRYSPNGNALEEENILGIKSCAKFGYQKLLPYLVAQNSAYAHTAFESFENEYPQGGTTYLEDGLILNSTDGVIATNIGHSGAQSLKLSNDADGLQWISTTVDGHLLDQGLDLKLWMKTTENNHQLITDHFYAEIRDPVSNNIVGSTRFEKLAQTGEWSLLQARITDLSSYLVVGDDFKLHLRYDFNSSGVQNLWIDDIRMQVLDAQMGCYVYDRETLRLLTSFDDQHFGLYYQYDAEGKLIRKLLETERGMKTVQEAQYNVPKVNQN